MQFAQPIWIITGLFCCAGLAFLLMTMQRSRQARLEQFTGHQLAARLTRHVSPRQRILKGTLLVLAVFFLFAALARPQYGYRWVDVTRKGIDILFALDTSRSMLAEDLKPNRLERAKLGILDFVSRLEGDRVGLMPFAGSPYLMTPLTLDYNAFQSSLKAIDTKIIPHGGTNIGGVIQEAEKVLENDANHKILILLTDGENLEGDALEAAGKAKEKGMTIYTVGVGTPAGELIPAKDGGAGFVKDEDGRYITSKLDETALKDIAEATEAIYTPLGTSGQGLDEIYRQKLSLIPKEELMEKRHKVPLERFGWPLTISMILLLLEYLIPDRKSNHRFSLPSIITSGRRSRKTLVLLLLAPSFLSSPNAYASPATKGYEAYTEGQFVSASELYSEALSEEPQDPELHYNYGTSAYQNNMYDDAIASFTQALKGPSLSLQEKAYYNRGNAYYKKGEETIQAAPRETAELWQQAIDSYSSALQLNSGNDRAAENKAFIEKKLEELKEKQEQQQQKQDSQEQQPDQDGQENADKPQQENSLEKQEQQGQDNRPGEEQNDGEKHQKETSPAPEKEEQQPEQGKGEKIEQASPPNPVGSEQQPDGQPASPRQEGTMSKEEAANLLKAIESEEGDLNFVPNFSPQNSGRDW